MKRNVLYRKILMLLPLFLPVIFAGLSQAGDEDYYFQEGTRLLKQAKLDRAAAGLTEAIQLAPDHVEAYNNRGLVYFEQKNYEQAQEDFLAAIRLSPFDKQANNNLGVLFCSQQDYDHALLYFERAIKKGGAPTSYDMAVYRNLAFVYLKKGMQEEAAEAYETARNIQDRVSGSLDLREYGEGTRDYTLAIEFDTSLALEKQKTRVK